MRNVRLNLNIAKGCPIKDSGKTKKNGKIQFLSVMEESVGPEQFIFMVKLEVFDELLKTMKSMAEYCTGIVVRIGN